MLEWAVKAPNEDKMSRHGVILSWVLFAINGKRSAISQANVDGRRQRRRAASLQGAWDSYFLPANG